MNVTVNISDRISPTLRQMLSSLEGSDRVELHQAMGTEVQHVTTEHLRELAATRHATASRLGAAPSNHFAQAAEKVAAPAALSADANEATLTINHPGLSRAFGDVKITPKTAKALTIPIHAMAYARRAGEFPGIFRLGGRGQDVGKNILAIKDGESVLPLFLLVRSVTQRQDRSLLPSDDQWTTAALRGAGTFLKLMTQGGAQ